MWLLGFALEEQSVLLTAEPSLQPLAEDNFVESVLSSHFYRSSGDQACAGSSFTH